MNLIFTKNSHELNSITFDCDVHINPKINLHFLGLATSPKSSGSANRRENFQSLLNLGNQLLRKNCLRTAFEPYERGNSVIKLDFSLSKSDFKKCQ